MYVWQRGSGIGSEFNSPPCPRSLRGAQSKGISAVQSPFHIPCLCQSARINCVSNATNVRLERVFAQLRLYEHPLLDFSARAKGEGVEIIIQFKNPSIPVHTYYFDLHPRDLDDPQFEWSFQRQLYDCLHDYLVEMFTRTPQNRVERQREGL
jgi:hypothetical protein